MIPAIEVLIKTDKIDGLNEIMKKIEELREANPRRTIKVSLEVSLRD